MEVRPNTVADDARALVDDAIAARRVPARPPHDLLVYVAGVVSNALKVNRHRDKAVAISSRRARRAGGRTPQRV